MKRIRDLSPEAAANIDCLEAARLVKKISAYAPLRTPNLWVEKQASYH